MNSKKIVAKRLMQRAIAVLSSQKTRHSRQKAVQTRLTKLSTLMTLSRIWRLSRNIVTARR